MFAIIRKYLNRLLNQGPCARCGSTFFPLEPGNGVVMVDESRGYFVCPDCRDELGLPPHPGF